MPPIGTRQWFQGSEAIPNAASIAVVPDTVVRQWEAEAHRFLEPGVTEVLVYSKESHEDILSKVLGPRAGGYLIIISKSKLITAFSQAPGDALIEDGGDAGVTSRVQPSLFCVPFLLVFVDELQNYRNFGQAYLALQRLCSYASVRLGLTATPIPTRLENLLYECRAIGVEGLMGDSGLKYMSKVQTSMSKIRRSVNLDASSMLNIYQADAWERVKEQVNDIKSLISASILRRTTKSRDAHGNPLIPLPSLRLEIIPIELAAHEQEVVTATQGWWASGGSAADRARKFEVSSHSIRKTSY